MQYIYTEIIYSVVYFQIITIQFFSSCRKFYDVLYCCFHLYYYMGKVIS